MKATKTKQATQGQPAIIVLYSIRFCVYAFNVRCEKLDTSVFLMELYVGMM